MLDKVTFVIYISHLKCINVIEVENGILFLKEKRKTYRNKIVDHIKMIVILKDKILWEHYGSLYN